MYRNAPLSLHPLGWNLDVTSPKLNLNWPSVFIIHCYMKGGQWHIRGEIRRHTREIFVSFCRELLVPKKFSYNLKEFRLFSMSARCQQEIFFLGKKILLYARNENFSSMPPSHAMSLSIGNGLFGEIFSPYARNFRIFL